MIVNHNQDKESTVTITGNKDITTTGNNNNLDSKRNCLQRLVWRERCNQNERAAQSELPTGRSGSHFTAFRRNKFKRQYHANKRQTVFSGRPTPHAYNHLGSGWSKWKVSHKEKSCGTTIGSTAHLKRKTSIFRADKRWFPAMLPKWKAIGI